MQRIQLSNEELLCLDLNVNDKILFVIIIYLIFQNIINLNDFVLFLHFDSIERIQINTIVVDADFLSALIFVERFPFAVNESRSITITCAQFLEYMIPCLGLIVIEIVEHFTHFNRNACLMNFCYTLCFK